MNETRLFHVANNVRSIQHRAVLPALLLVSSSVLLLLSGCGSGMNFAGTGSTGPAELSALQGKVHGGQAPVVGATVSLYEIGSGQPAPGYGAALGTALGVSAPTISDGGWSIPSPTACANANDELYLVASGGMENGNSTANSALVMTTVAGLCGGPDEQFSNIYGSPVTTFNIDEVTTVATEYALAGFSTDYQHVGAPSSNMVGLTNAFATVTNLVNLTTGQALVNTPAYPAPGAAPANQPPDVFSSIVPQDAINTLANVLATCVNAAGGASDSQCTNLFSYTGGTNSAAVGTNGVQGPAATTTADAALFIAHNPGLPTPGGPANGSNVAAIYGYPHPEAPFGPALTGAPNDFTLTLNFVGGGLGGSALSSAAGGSQLTIDMNGGIWVVGSRSKYLTALSNLGVPASFSPNTTVTGTTLDTRGGIAITSGSELGTPSITSTRFDTDQQGNVWVADQTNCLWAFSGSTGSQLSGSPFTSTSICPTDSPHTVTVDASNNVWIGGTNFIGSVSNPSGTPRTGFPITSGFNVLTTFLQPDEAGNVWWTDQGAFTGGFVEAGTATSTSKYLFGNAPNGYAAFGTLSQGLALEVPEPAGPSIQPVEAVSPFIAGEYSPPNTPTGYEIGEIWSDGNNRFWFASGASSSAAANIGEYLANGSQVSGSGTGDPNGFEGASALMELDLLDGMAIDQSGNAWVVNGNNYNALHQSGPYGGQYAGNGASATNLTEFIGLAAPTQPVNSFNAKNSTYGAKP